MELNHEKYISIEYDKWESYYKKLEETNRKLINDISELQEGKRLRLILDIRGTDIHWNRREIGVVEFDVRHSGTFSLQVDTKAIKDAIERRFEEFAKDWHIKIVDYKTAQDIANRVQELNKESNDIATANNEIIAKLPKWIRNLLNLKLIRWTSQW